MNSVRTGSEITNHLDRDTGSMGNTPTLGTNPLDSDLDSDLDISLDSDSKRVHAERVQPDGPELVTELRLRDEEGRDEEFLRHQRRRTLKRVAAGALACAAGLAAWALLPQHIDQLLALTPRSAADDPRVVFAQSSFQAADASTDGSRAALARVFGQTFPEWLDALRAAQLASRAIKTPLVLEGTSQVPEFTALREAREALKRSIGNDDALQAVMRSMMTLAEQDVAGNQAALQETIGNLNLLAQSRHWPFVVEGGVVKEERGEFLQLRTYERVGEVPFRSGPDTVTVAYLDRLSLGSLWREPEQRSNAGSQNTVYVRAITTELNATLWSALHTNSTWQLSTLTPTLEPMTELEKSLGAQVWEEWQSKLATEAPEGAVQALAALSKQVAQRNELYRAINDRDPRVISIASPSSLAGLEGQIRLNYLEPYAMQGRIRLTMEDIVTLRRWDKQLDNALTAAGPALQIVMKSLFDQAGIAEVRRSQLIKSPSGTPEAQQALAAALVLEPIQALTTLSEIGAELTVLVESTETCRTSMGLLASRAGETGSLEATAAQVTLTALKAGPDALNLAPASSPEARLDALQTLQKEDCAALSIRAKDVYQRMFGPYSSITPALATVAGLKLPSPPTP